MSCLAPLGEAADFVNGFAFKPADWTGRGKPIIRIQNLTDSKRPFNFTEKAIPAKYNVSQGDLLVSWSATLGVFEWTGQDALVNQHIFKVVPNPDRGHIPYLRHAIDACIHRMEKFTHGSTMKHINRKEFLETEVWLPSLDEQRRIATILDKADGIRRKRELINTSINEMLRATFLETFGDPRKVLDSDLTLSDVAQVARGRFSPRPRNDPRFYDGAYPFIQTGEIANSDGYMSNFRQTLNDEGIKVSKSFPVGTVYIAIVGATIGATAISTREFWCPDSVIGIVPKNSDYPAEFLEYLLRFWRPVFVDRAPETARANINLQTLKPVPIPMCNNGEAKKFGKLYRKLHDLKSSLQQLDDDLFASLSQRAFRGEL